MPNFKSAQVIARESMWTIGATSLQTFQTLNPPVTCQNLIFPAVLMTVPATTLLTSDTFELLRLPTAARIVNIYGTWQSLGTTVTTDIGLYTPRGFGLAPVLVAGAQSILVSALAFNAAIGTIASIQNTAAANWGKMLWELAGLTSDPGGEYVITATFTSVASPTAGNNAYLSFWVEMP